MAKATETLKKSRTVQFNFTMDADALAKALGAIEDAEEGDENDKEEETTAASVLKKKRVDEMPIVKLSQIPMAG